MKSRLSESSEKYSPSIMKMVIVIDTSTSRKINNRRRLNSQFNVDSNVNYNEFKDGNVTKAASRFLLVREGETIVSCILLFDTHHRQILSWHNTLNSKELIKYSIECGYYWKKKIKIQQPLNQIKSKKI